MQLCPGLDLPKTPPETINYLSFPTPMSFIHRIRVIWLRTCSVSHMVINPERVSMMREIQRRGVLLAFLCVSWVQYGFQWDNVNVIRLETIRFSRQQILHCTSPELSRTFVHNSSAPAHMATKQLQRSLGCEQSGAAEFSSASTHFALFCLFCKIFPVLVKIIFDYIDNRANIISAEEPEDLSAYFLTTTKHPLLFKGPVSFKILLVSFSTVICVSILFVNSPEMRKINLWCHKGHWHHS